MKKWGVTRRALFLGLAPASAIAALLVLYLTTVRFEEIEQALAERGLAIARQLALGAEYGVFSGNRQVLQNLAESALIKADVTAVTINDARGAVLAQSGLPVADPRLAIAFTARITMSRTALEDFPETSPEGERKTLGLATVELSRASIMAKKKRLLVDTFFITLVGLFITWIMAVRMSRGITHPILQLADTVEKFGKGELDLRAETYSGGSLGGLQAGFNKMATALQSAQSDLEARIRDATAQLTEKKAEADRANLAKSRFLAAASHDLRQPVHALGLFVAELKAQDLGPEANRLAEMIEAGVLALSDLLDSMLDISKLDAGALPARISHFSIGDILDRMEVEFEPVAREKGLRFKIVPSHATVKSDPVLLERIVLNLVANAVRYTNAGGILIGCRRRGQSLILQVWDTGVGIPENRRDYIFQEFYQLGNPERDRRKGLGLGLAIVERLARLLDHKVELTSTCGVGSIFSLQIPLGEPQL
ncbi:MAG: ATP-binding protein, partial [Burkholderiales bacterium]